MSNKLSLSIILPIKSSKTKDFNAFFDKAIASLEKQETDFDELVIVHTKEDTLVKFLNEYDFKNLNVKKFEWTSEPNYCSQINYGVEKASSEWVSLFEFDDEYSNIWFKNFRKYAEVYPDYAAFLPVVVDVDAQEVFAGFTN